MDWFIIQWIDEATLNGLVTIRGAITAKTKAHVKIINNLLVR